MVSIIPRHIVVGHGRPEEVEAIETIIGSRILIDSRTGSARESMVIVFRAGAIGDGGCSSGPDTILCVVSRGALQQA